MIRVIKTTGILRENGWVFLTTQAAI